MSISSYGSTGGRSGGKLKFKGNASSAASAFTMLSSIFSNEENEESSVANDDELYGTSNVIHILTYSLKPQSLIR